VTTLRTRDPANSGVPPAPDKIRFLHNRSVIYSSLLLLIFIILFFSLLCHILSKLFHATPYLTYILEVSVSSFGQRTGHPCRRPRLLYHPGPVFTFPIPRFY